MRIGVGMAAASIAVRAGGGEAPGGATFFDYRPGALPGSTSYTRACEQDFWDPTLGTMAQVAANVAPFLEAGGVDTLDGIFFRACLLPISFGYSCPKTAGAKATQAAATHNIGVADGEWDLAVLLTTGSMTLLGLTAAGGAGLDITAAMLGGGEVAIKTITATAAGAPPPAGNAAEEVNNMGAWHVSALTGAVTDVVNPAPPTAHGQTSGTNNLVDDAGQDIPDHTGAVIVTD